MSGPKQPIHPRRREHSQTDPSYLPMPEDAKGGRESGSQRIGVFEVTQMPPSAVAWVGDTDSLGQDKAVRLVDAKEDFYLPLGSCVGAFVYGADGELTGVSHHNGDAQALDKIGDEVKGSAGILVIRGPTTSKTQDGLVDSICGKLMLLGAERESIQVYESPNYSHFRESISSGVIAQVRLGAPLRLHFCNEPSKAFALEEVRPARDG